MYPPGETYTKKKIFEKNKKIETGTFDIKSKKKKEYYVPWEKNRINKKEKNTLSSYLLKKVEKWGLSNIRPIVMMVHYFRSEFQE